jgi:hypothetical protein
VYVTVRETDGVKVLTVDTPPANAIKSGHRTSGPEPARR